MGDLKKKKKQSNKFDHYIKLEIQEWETLEKPH